MSILLDKTVELLKETPLQLKWVAKQVGCSQQTLSHLRNGCPSVPNVELCEKLYVLLSGKQLEL